VFQLPEFRRVQVNAPYGQLAGWARNNGFAWLVPMADRSERLIGDAPHGDLPRWLEALEMLPVAEPYFDGVKAAPVLGRPAGNGETLSELLMRLHPWRKGPLNVGGVEIDSEWRSDWKWDRVKGYLDLAGHRVLDIGCGNGYFGWRMLGQGAECVIGVDPTLVFVMQWLACRHFAGEQPNYVLPLGVEDLPDGAGSFDSVFSMGVLYHRKDPVRHLRRLASLATPEGQVVLETLVLEGDEDRVLVPEGRYARMRNVWAIPSWPRLAGWINEAGLVTREVMDVRATTTAEQRSTGWMRFESLEQCLDRQNPALTVEGHPAPVRCAVLCAVA
jgi:tRNA (mo5U34)-methyltransferase